MSGVYELKTTGETKLQLELAIKLACYKKYLSDDPEKTFETCKFFDKFENKILKFCTSLGKGFVELPVALDYKQMADLTWSWLAHVDYPSQPNIDGSLRKGWVLRTQECSKGYLEWNCVFSVEPFWIEYHK